MLSRFPATISVCEGDRVVRSRSYVMSNASPDQHAMEETVPGAVDASTSQSCYAAVTSDVPAAIPPPLQCVRNTPRSKIVVYLRGGHGCMTFSCHQAA